MTTTAACPACVGVSHDYIEQTIEDANTLELSVATMHCAGCMSTIEKGLMAFEDIDVARVNLSLKRVAVQHRIADLAEDTILDRLANLGFEAQYLDSKSLKQQSDETSRALLIKLGVSGFAAMNVMLLSVSVWAGAEGITRDFLHWVSAAIALPTVAYASQPFFKNAWAALSVKRLNMDVPISLAILLACALSLYETIYSGRHAYFDAALSLTFFLLAGRYLDYQTRAKARSAAVELSALEVQRAQLVEEGIVKTVLVETLCVGDRILVRRGARIPIDGTVADGRSELDVSLLTGETMPVPVNVGDVVYSGTINIGAPFYASVSKTGQGTKLAEIKALVATAETLKTKYTTLADRAAQLYAPVVHLLALAAFIFWQLWSGDTRLAIGIATAVLIITCPCALGLAVPAVMTAASGRLYRAGILIKDGAALERLVDVDTVIFDKTGTLTTGEMTVCDAPTGYALQIAASLAHHSDHPQSQAILKYYGDKTILPLSDIEELPGQGLQCKLNGERIQLGRADWIGVKNKPDYVQCWLAIGDEEPVPFLFEDTLKVSSAESISQLKELGLNVVLLSGDTQSATDMLAEKLNIDTAIGSTLPDQKLSILKSFGDNTLMIGDGLNDTAALAAAGVSMSPAKAIDAARAASDFVLLKDDLTLITECIVLAKSAKQRILENFAISAGYNFVAIPIALLGFATPLLAAIAMSASSICVSLNALRLVKEK